MAIKTTLNNPRLSMRSRSEISGKGQWDHTEASRYCRLLPAIFLLLSACTPTVYPIKPTYQDVRPIFVRNCMACHNGQTNWTDETVATRNREKIYKRVVELRDMPRSGFLSEAERSAIGRWAR